MVALALVGNGEGNVAFLARLVAAEYGLDVGRVHVDIGHHHDDVPGPQRGIDVEGGEKLIVQNFHFPLRAVGLVERQGMIPLNIQLSLLLADFLEGRQVVDIVLQLMQQARCFRVAMVRENINFLVRGLEAAPVLIRVVELVQQPDVVPALLAPGGQQRIGVLVQLVRILNGGKCRMGPATFAFGGEQLPVADDVGPVELAGVVNTQHHLTEPAQDVQGFQRLPGQRRDAKHHDPGWQPGRVGRRLKSLALFHEPGMDLRAAGMSVCAHILNQPAPEQGLPAGFRIQRLFLGPGRDNHVLALLPGSQPVGPEHLVLIKQIGHLFRQLEIAQVRIVTFQKPGQRCKGLVLPHQTWQ